MQIFSLSLILSIFLFSFSTSMTPGPNNLMLMSSGLTFGYRKTLPHVLGVILGFPLMTLCVGLSLGEVFKYFPSTFIVLKVCGICYLLWLAWHISKSKPQLNGVERSAPLTFFPIILFQWVNVKNWIKIITATSVYVTSVDNSFNQIAVITAIFFSTVFISANSWALAGSFLKKLIKSDVGIRRFNIIMAVLLVLSIVPTIVE